MTGSSGFVGGRLCEKLSEAGHEVIGSDLQAVEGKKYRQISGPFNAPEVLQAIDSSTTVIHLAAVSTDRDCKSNPIAAVKTNIQDLIQFAHFCAQSNISHFIFASSEWVYPEETSISDQFETDSLTLSSLNSLYAMSKLVGEEFLRVVENLKITCLRFGIVYGPRDLPGSAPESFIMNVYDQKQISIGSYATARRFIFIEDLINGIYLASTRIPSSTFTIYNLAGKELLSLSKIIQTAESVTKKTTIHNELSTTPSIRNPNPAKFSEQFKWEPSTTIEQGLELCLKKMLIYREI